jgi:hypothetical protein
MAAGSKLASVKITVKITLSLSWCQAPIWGLRPQFYYCQTVAGYWCGAISLTRERVCRLQLRLVLASAVIHGSESRGTSDYILLSQIRDSPNLEGQVLVFKSLKNRVAQLYPQALGSLCVASYDSKGYSGGIRTSLHSGKELATLASLHSLGLDHIENPSTNSSSIAERLFVA